MGQKPRNAKLPPDWIRGFGDRIRLVREKAKLSQKALAGRLGASTGDAVSRLEIGSASGITLSSLAELITFCRENGYSAEWLMTGKSVTEAMTPGQLLDAYLDAKYKAAYNKKKAELLRLMGRNDPFGGQ